MNKKEIKVRLEITDKNKFLNLVNPNDYLLFNNTLKGFYSKEDIFWFSLKEGEEFQKEGTFTNCNHLVWGYSINPFDTLEKHIDINGVEFDVKSTPYIFHYKLIG
jgi:hypothetical protein